MKKKKNNIQSINIGFSIINVLLESPIELPLKQISSLCGLQPSKIHSYMVSFMSIGLVVQNPSTNRYTLGPYCLRLGIGYIDKVNLFSVAKPFMEKLSDKIGHTVFLGVWGNKGPTIVYRVDSRHPTGVLELRIGSVLPVLDSALGLNFLAHLPSSYTKPNIERELKKHHIFKNKKDLNVKLDEIKQAGISASSGNILAGYTAISVPIIDFTETMIAGLTIMGKIGELDDRVESETAEKLKFYGKSISEGRGHKGNK